MKTIFETFKKSIYNPAFYREAAEKPLSSIIKYYAKATLLLTVFLVVVMGLYLIPRGVMFVKERAPYLVSAYYPKELVVKIDKGVASANVPMPYVVPLKTLSIDATVGGVQNMLVINTDEEFVKSKFDEYSTYALLTKTDIVSRGENDSITIQPLSRTLTTVISQDTLSSWVVNIQDFLWWVILIIIVAMFVFAFLGYMMYLVPLLLFAFIPKLVAYIKKTPLSYQAAYKMSLYAIVPALALKTLLNALHVFFLPSYFTFLVFMLIITINMREEAEPTLFDESNKKNI